MNATKLFLAVVLVASLALASSTTGTCPKSWVKLNDSPVCYGAKGDSYGSFTYGKNIFVSAFKLVYLSGYVSCDGSRKSNWCCDPNKSNLCTVITDGHNNVIAPNPKPSNIRSYTIPGYTSSSPDLVFCRDTTLCVFSTTEIRLWYAEDLLNTSEGDNSGETCADVYALLA